MASVEMETSTPAPKPKPGRRAKRRELEASIRLRLERGEHESEVLYAGDAQSQHRISRDMLMPRFVEQRARFLRRMAGVESLRRAFEASIDRGHWGLGGREQSAHAARDRRRVLLVGEADFSFCLAYLKVAEALSTLRETENCNLGRLCCSSLGDTVYQRIYRGLYDQDLVDAMGVDCQHSMLPGAADAPEDEASTSADAEDDDFLAAFSRAIVDVPPLEQLEVVATTIESEVEVVSSLGKQNIAELRARFPSACQLHFEVDGTKLGRWQSDLGTGSFDEVIFNFPCLRGIGGREYKKGEWKHQTRQLVERFLQNVHLVLKPETGTCRMNLYRGGTASDRQSWEAIYGLTLDEDADAGSLALPLGEVDATREEAEPADRMQSRSCDESFNSIAPIGQSAGWIGTFLLFGYSFCMSSGVTAGRCALSKGMWHLWQDPNNTVSLVFRSQSEAERK